MSLPLTIIVLPVVHDEPEEKHRGRVDGAERGEGERRPRLEEVARAPGHAPRLEEVGVLRAPCLSTPTSVDTGNDKTRGTHGNGGRDDLLPILDDDMDVRVRLGDEDRLRADAAPDVDQHRALGKILPREPCPTTSERHSYACISAR